MKVEKKEKETEFRNIEIGETFIFKKDVYMKVGGIKGIDRNSGIAVILNNLLYESSNLNMTCFFLGELVEKANFKLVEI